MAGKVEHCLVRGDPEVLRHSHPKNLPPCLCLFDIWMSPRLLHLLCPLGFSRAYKKLYYPYIVHNGFPRECSLHRNIAGIPRLRELYQIRNELKMGKRTPILVYLTSDERQRITALAQKVGMDRSAYIRHQCLNENPNLEPVNRDLAQLLCDLANAAQELDCDKALRERLSRLEEQLWQSIE